MACSVLTLFVILQTPTRLTFEVASIKQAETKDPNQITGWNCRGFDQPNVGTPPPALAVLTVAMGRCRLYGWTVKRYVSVLYQVSEDRVLGTPDWAATLPYVIEAKADDALKATRAQLIEMTKNLFEDRFKLKLHREEREVDGFEIVQVNGSHKMKPPAEGSRPSAQGGIGNFKGVMTVDMMAGFVSRQLDVPVTDGTGLKERFEVNVSWTPGPGQPGYNVNADPGATITTAVQETLGLRLQPKKQKIQLIVIDSVENPIEN